jgi:cytochrome c oxidase assembly protein subunit 15
MSFVPDYPTLGLLASVLAVAIAGALGFGLGVRNAVRADARPEDQLADAPVVWLARGSIALVAATWVLIVLGASVRVNGAGLACPDWPACFGQLVPQLDWKVSLEYFHRVCVSGVSLGLIGMFTATAIASIWRPALRRVVPLYGVAFAVLVVQIVLGGLTVLNLLAEWTVASHLVFGNAFAACLLVVALATREVAAPSVRAPITATARAVAGVLAVLLVTQLALGGLVSSSHSGLACGTWPGCNGSAWFPTLHGAVGLQVMHRITGYSLLGVALAAVATSSAGHRRVAVGVLLLVVAQATLGVSNVLLRLPVEVTLLHSAGAAAVVLATTWLNVEAWRAPLAVGIPGLSTLPAEAK